MAGALRLRNCRGVRDCETRRFFGLSEPARTFAELRSGRPSIPGAIFAQCPGNMGIKRVATLRGDQTGASLVEMVITAAILITITGIGIGVSSTLLRMTRGESGAQQLDAFLRRHREMAVARRRDIEIWFLAPNQVESRARAVPNPPAATPAPTVLERITFEGGIRFGLFPGLPDTPNLFGAANAIALGGATPVMFSSEGSFLDTNNNPINASLFLGIPEDPLSATAVTVLGATGTVERWRWDGTRWAR
jgi:hypothetical protein